MTIKKKHRHRQQYLKYNSYVVRAIKRDKNKCRDCGSDKSLVVHHLDESRKNGYKSMNNNLDNLITVCRSCHAIRHKMTMQFRNPNYALIKELRLNGYTVSYIGNYLGISRQRVHQIIKKAFPEIVS